MLFMHTHNLLQIRKNNCPFRSELHLNSQKAERREVNMGNNLQNLFDFQRFENNPRLKSMLNEAMERYGFSEDEGELSDDEAEWLSAAGSQVTDKIHGKEKRV